MKKPRLQILVATFEKVGLERLASSNLPVMEEVEYIVSCQNPSRKEIPIPASLNRSDVKIFFSPTRGLSRNRNILLDRATAPICLIADDDLVYSSEGLLEVIATFEENPEVDVATFAYTVPGGGTEKNYPPHSFNLLKPTKGYFITSFEIAFRRERVMQSGVQFNEEFGIGAPVYGCGEEDLWIAGLLSKKLTGRFFPIFIAEHQGETTGIRNAAKPEVLRAQGAIIRLTYPYTSLPRIVLKSHRTSKATGAGFFFCLRLLLEGWTKKIKL